MSEEVTVNEFGRKDSDRFRDTWNPHRSIKPIYVLERLRVLSVEGEMEKREAEE